MRDRRWVAHLVKSRLNGSRDKLGQLFNSSRIVMQRLIGPRRLRALSLSNPPHFPVFDQMVVSIIISVFNQWQDTLACLESIAHLTAGPSYEVIVVDDGSSDETPQMLTQIEGLLTLRNEQNLGFVGSCNRGAATARGAFLVFLNNNTEVTPGWLEDDDSDRQHSTPCRGRGRQAGLPPRPPSRVGKRDLA